MSITGARFSLIASLLPLGLLLSPSLSPALTEPGAVVASGEIRFVVDAVSFRGEAGKVREEFYILIPTDDLVYEAGDGGLPEAVIAVRFRFRQWPTGVPLLDEESRATFGPPDPAKSSPDLQVLQKSFSLDPGRYQVEVRVQDQKSRGFGFFHLFGRSPDEGVAVGNFEARTFRTAGADVSDIQFARRFEDPEGDEFAKGKWAVIPQPNRLYGVFMPTLYFYYELYDPSDLRDPGGEPYRVRHQIVDEGGVVRAEEEQALSVWGRGDRFRRAVSMDITGVPSGRYLLRVEVVSDTRADTVTSESPFEVVWRAADLEAPARAQVEPDWYYEGRTGDDVLLEVQVILTPDELNHLAALSKPDREAWLEQYWSDRDPTPGTERNELRDEHYRRVQLANRRFPSIRKKGMETDRGRIFIRYGEPDEIRVDFANQSFVRDEDVYGGQPDLIDDANRFRGGFNVDEKAYEVWTYTGRGRILADRKKVGSGLGLRFVFVDRMGYGDYELVESSELSDF